MAHRIRYLKAGDPIPEGEPRRYKDPRGYVRLRWKLGKGDYLEAWEHRILTGAVDGQHVHHVNRDTGDNSPENLVILAAGEHSKTHAAERRLDDARIVWAYLDGATTVQIADELGCTPGAVSRVLKRNSVMTRTSTDYKTLPLDIERIAALFTQGWSPTKIGNEMGCSDRPIRSRLLAMGFTMRRRGRYTHREYESCHRDLEDSEPKWTSAS